MNNLSLQTYVVVCRQMGTYHIDKQRASNLQSLLDSSNRPKSIQIDGAYISTSDIVGIVTAERYDETQRERKGQWKCQYAVWHLRDEQCRCAWGKGSKQRNPLPEKDDRKISPEQAEKNRIILSLIRKKKASFIDMKHLKSKTIDQLRQML